MKDALSGIATIAEYAAHEFRQATSPGNASRSTPSTRRRRLRVARPVESRVGAVTLETGSCSDRRLSPERLTRFRHRCRRASDLVLASDSPSGPVSSAPRMRTAGDTSPGAIENQQLLLDQYGLGYHGIRRRRPIQSLPCPAWCLRVVSLCSLRTDEHGDISHKRRFT